MVYLSDRHPHIFIIALKLLSAIYDLSNITTDQRLARESDAIRFCQDVDHHFDNIVEQVLKRVNTFKNESIIYRELLFESVANLTQVQSSQLKNLIF